MRYGSVCSGIEAATMAWHALGWVPAFFSEIEAFPSAVLAHHYGSNMPGEPLSKNGIPGGYAGRRQEADANIVAFMPTESFSSGDNINVAPTLRVGSGLSERGEPPAVAFQERGRSDGRSVEWQEGVAYSLNAPSGGGRRQEMNVAASWAVRRLMPVECERLQGFPDGFTDVPWRGKSVASDGPRYKALGNSMAVNVMRWIGQRIAKVEEICADLDKEAAK